jgi:hypothetical protein
MKEVWKDVIGYEGLYQVSNLGRVKSLPRNGTANIEKILCPSNNGNGYLHVMLSNKSKKTFYIHRLVYNAFNNINSIKGKTAIDHINNDKNDNRLCNLQLITQRENKRKSTNSNTGLYNIYKVRNKYRVIIYSSEGSKHIGYFVNLEDAINERDNYLKSIK